MEDRIVQCDCGFEACAADEAGLVAGVQQHAWEAHGMALSDDEALLLAFHAELRDAAPPAIPPPQTTEGGGAIT